MAIKIKPVKWLEGYLVRPIQVPEHGKSGSHLKFPVDTPIKVNPLTGHAWIRVNAQTKYQVSLHFFDYSVMV